MPRVPKGKKRIEIYISEEIYRKLMEYVSAVASSEGRIRGVLSEVVEAALQEYLAPRLQHTKLHTNPSLRIRKVYGQILQAIASIRGGLPPDGIIHEKILSLAISEVRGSDPRTVEKWINILMRAGLLKIIGGVAPNRVFELVYTPQNI